MLAARPDGLGVCHVEAGDGTDKVTMVCDDDVGNDDDDDDDDDSDENNKNDDVNYMCLVYFFISGILLLRCGISYCC